jgi:hypothetical protein
MRLGSLVCDLLTSIYLMVSYIFSGVWKVDHAVKYCIFIMRVLFCVFCISIHEWNGEVPPPPHSTDNSTFTFTLYFKYFLRILCTFYLSTFCLQYFLLLLMQVVLLLITSTFTRV